VVAGRLGSVVEEVADSESGVGFTMIGIQGDDLEPLRDGVVQATDALKGVAGSEAARDPSGLELERGQEGRHRLAMPLDDEQRPAEVLVGLHQPGRGENGVGIPTNSLQTAALAQRRIRFHDQPACLELADSVRLVGGIRDNPVAIVDQSLHGFDDAGVDHSAGWGRRRAVWIVVAGPEGGAGDEDRGQEGREHCCEGVTMGHSLLLRDGLPIIGRRGCWVDTGGGEHGRCGE